MWERGFQSEKIGGQNVDLDSARSSRHRFTSAMGIQEKGPVTAILISKVPMFGVTEKLSCLEIVKNLCHRESSLVQYSITQYSIPQYSVGQDSTHQNSISQYSNEQYSFSQYSTGQYCMT
jgi:hypothetical protein